MQDRGWQKWVVREWGYLVAIALAIAVYLPAVGGEPIWDDVIVFDRFLPAFGGIGDAFFPPADTGELGQYYYRPLITISYMFDRWLAGGGAYYIDHLTVIVFHAATALGVGMLTRRLMPAGDVGRWASFAAACCFAVHPVHVDSVAQITGRSDVMAAAFLVFAMLALLRGRDRPELHWPWVAAGVLFFAGLLSKEVSVLGIAIGALLLALPRRAPPAVWTRFAIALGAAAVLYAILRSSADVQSAKMLEQGFGESIARMVRATGYYVQMVVLPFDQSAFVPFESTPPVWFGAVAVTVLAGLGVVSWRARASRAILLLAWCWFALTLLPSLALLVLKASEQPVAERYLYLPSIAVSMAFGWLAGTVGVRAGAAKLTLAAVALAIAAGAVATALRATIYRDGLTFWTEVVGKAPDAGLPQYQLGLTLRQDGKLDEALTRLRRSLGLYDDAEGRSLAHNTIGTIHLERKRYDDAEQEFLAAVQERPGYASPWFNLAGTYAMRAETKRGPQNAPDLADTERCVDALGKALEARSNYDKARVQLATQSLLLTKIYLASGRRDDANRMRDRARLAADWLVQRDPRGPMGQQGQAVLQELQRLPR